MSAALAEAASVHIFEVSRNDDWTFHIPLPAGRTTRLKLKLYTAAGREISPLQYPLQLNVTFSPTSLATASVADSALLLFDVTPTDTVGSEGGMHITLTEPATATTKGFGSFYVLVHPY